MQALKRLVRAAAGEASCRLRWSVAVVVALAILTGHARAVVIDTLTGLGNTSAPADDPGWANVGVLGVGTGVYLGNRWVLTAAHVGAGSIVLNGGTYAMQAGSVTRLTNNGLPGTSGSTDLIMFQLTTAPPGLPDITIASGSAALGEAVTMIGAGRDRGAFTEWSVSGTTWTQVPSGGDAAGYQTLGTRSMRWGTNDVDASGLWIDDGFGDVFMLGTTFTASGTPSSEAQAAYGDSGGGVFRKQGSAWELSGIILTVGGYAGQPDPGANAIYGDATYAADLSFYRSQIITIVPEPASAALVATALVVLHAAVTGRHRGRAVRGRSGGVWATGGPAARPAGRGARGG